MYTSILNLFVTFSVPPCWLLTMRGMVKQPVRSGSTTCSVLEKRLTYLIVRLMNGEYCPSPARDMRLMLVSVVYVCTDGLIGISIASPPPQCVLYDKKKSILKLHSHQSDYNSNPASGLLSDIGRRLYSS